MEVRLKLQIAESEWDMKGKFNFNPTLMWVKGSILAEEFEPLKKSLAAKTSETVPLIRKISFISCKQVNFGGFVPAHMKFSFLVFFTACSQYVDIDLQGSACLICLCC